MADAALNADPTAGAYNGLKQPERTLESSWYFDPAHYQRELAAIWRRNWIYLCRAESLAGTALVPDLQHRRSADPAAARRGGRGSRLLQHLPPPRFDAVHRGRRANCRTRSITCPYHAWTLPAGRHAGEDPLDAPRRAISIPRNCRCIRSAQESGAGSCTSTSTDANRPLNGSFQREPGDNFGHWPLEDLAVGRRLTKRLQLQLEGVLGELQRVPALSGRAPGAEQPGADLQARHHGVARRSEVARARAER